MQANKKDRKATREKRVKQSKGKKCVEGTENKQWYPNLLSKIY